MKSFPRASTDRFTTKHGYILVLFVVIVAFVAVMGAMQVLILTSVATTSRAYDAYRQGATEMVRLEEAVTETMLEQREVSVRTTSPSIVDSVNAHLADIAPGGVALHATAVPPALPPIHWFPDQVTPPDPLMSPTSDVVAVCPPELAWLCGPRVASYPEVRFEFSSERDVLDAKRPYRTEVRARLIAVPLTRFPIAAYDLPSEIAASVGGAAPAATALQGLVPDRDVASLSDMQSQRGVLPYHYRRRAVLSAAYQYVFSQQFIERCVDYAGRTHFHDLSDGGETTALQGMTREGPVTTWNLANAGSGTYGGTSAMRDAAVLFTEVAGRTLQLLDTSELPDRKALLLLLLGPANSATGPLAVELSSICRPIVIIGYNIRVSAAPGSVVQGALLLDPASSITAGTTVTLGHLSYWAGMPGAAQIIVTGGVLPAAAEALAPRAVYVATQAGRL